MSTAGRTLVIINPISGPRRSRSVDACTALVHDVLATPSGEVEVAVTTARGDAHRLAAQARAAGAAVVVAWGGDGTINEVASALVRSSVTLGIVPGGSGNGLARELGIPRDPRRALQVIAGQARRQIDAGQLDGHWFFNVAGVGLDAEVAHHIARPDATRGFWGYLRLALTDGVGYRGQDYTVHAPAASAHRALFIAFANSRQYGNNAIIAPRARLDDGLVDVVVVDQQQLWRLLRRAPALFRGTLRADPRLHMHQTAEVTVESARPMRVHVDGEPLASRERLRVVVAPRALIVAVAASN